MEGAVSQRMNGNLELRVLSVHLRTRGWGLTGMDMLLLADPFPAQKPQDCVVVGGCNHIQKL